MPVVTLPCGKTLNALYIRSCEKHRHWRSKRGFYVRLVFRPHGEEDIEDLSSTEADDWIERITEAINDASYTGDAYDDAYAGGREDGYREGYEEGRNNGYSAGLTEAQEADSSRNYEESSSGGYDDPSDDEYCDEAPRVSDPIDRLRIIGAMALARSRLIEGLKRHGSRDETTIELQRMFAHFTENVLNELFPGEDNKIL